MKPSLLFGCLALLWIGVDARADLLQAAGRRPSVHARDFQQALLRQRPRARTMPTLDQLSTFKGFAAEQSLLRRRQRNAPSGETWAFAAANDGVADLVRTEPGGRRVRVQQYAGASPRAAFEKLIGSDAAADELIVPRDVHVRMNAAVREAEAIHRRFAAGQLDRQTALRQVRRRIAGTGLTLDGENFSLNSKTKVGLRSLGRLGIGETERMMSRVKPDTLTSAQSSRNALRGLLDPKADTSLGRLADALDLRAASDIDAVAALLRNREEVYRIRGLKTWQASRKASNWLRITEAPRIRRELATAYRQAEALGVAADDLARIRAIPRAGSTPDRLAAMQHDLRAASRTAGMRQHMVGQGAAAVFLLAGAGFDLYLSDQELEEWLRSDRAAEWGIRGGMTAGIVAASIQVERTLAREAAKAAGKAGGRSAIARLAATLGATTGRRMLVIGGVAGSLFVAGESLIQVYGHGRSFAEVSGQFYESMAVMAATEGAYFGAAYLAGAAGAGSWAGPIGIGVAVGTAVAYEGAKYAWVFHRDLRTSTAISLKRADIARETSERYYLKLAKVAAE